MNSTTEESDDKGDVVFFRISFRSISFTLFRRTSSKVGFLHDEISECVNWRKFVLEQHFNGNYVTVYVVLCFFVCIFVA